MCFIRITHISLLALNSSPAQETSEIRPENFHTDDVALQRSVCVSLIGCYLQLVLLSYVLGPKKFVALFRNFQHRKKTEGATNSWRWPRDGRNLFNNHPWQSRSQSPRISCTALLVSSRKAIADEVVKELAPLCSPLMTRPSLRYWSIGSHTRSTNPWNNCRNECTGPTPPSIPGNWVPLMSASHSDKA